MTRRTLPAAALAAPGLRAGDDAATPYLTPHNYGRLVLAAASEPSAFDGAGYQTGVAAFCVLPVS